MPRPTSIHRRGLPTDWPSASFGAAMIGDEMIDEASRKMALVVTGKGRAAGMRRQTPPFEPPA